MSNHKNNSPEKNNKQNEDRSEERTPLDAHDDQKFVDDTPMKDLKIGMKQEKDKHKSQDDSESARKYKADFKKKTE